MSFTGLLIFSYLIKLHYCFNFDTNSPIIYEDPSRVHSLNSNKSSYFGYSVVLYPGNNREKPWILIGAPRGHNKAKVNSGACFKCGIGEICELFDVHGLSKHSNNEKIDSAWIGGSMDINFESDRIVTCAPRWITVKKGTNSRNDDYYMEGACYWFHSNDNDTQELLPLLEPDRAIYTHPNGGGSVYNYAQGESGFSVHLPAVRPLPTKNQRTELLLGAPGVYNWDGTSILYKDSYEPDPVSSRLQNQNRRLRAADISEFASKNIASAVKTKQTLAYDLLGYSVTSGYFYSKRELLYVTSAPRSNYQGQVLIYDFDVNSEEALNVMEYKLGKQFGEYFGASVTAGDINGDKLDDLIVGAPFHVAKKYNEGKIYIFLGSTTGHLQTPKRDSVEGQSINGQFGTTLQFLGDIDHDGYGDVAVAAPYEEEKSGVVYIFRGLHDGLDTTYCQRIVGKDVYQNIRGFGMSISRPADMNMNAYPDIVIGAYLSGHVTLLRSSPVVTIYQELKSFVPHLEFNARSFKMSACYWYKLDQAHAPQISIKRSLSVDPQLERALLQSGSAEKRFDLRPNNSLCENFTVVLTNSFSNRYDPITVSLSHVFIGENRPKEIVYVNSTKHGDDPFCPRCPVYNKYGSVSSSTVEVPFALGCKSKNICKANLEVKPEILNIQEEDGFVLGSQDSLILQINITNFGEKAYLTQVLVTLPEIMTFGSTPTVCSERNSSSVSCAVDNPLDSNSQKTVTLELDMTNVNRGKFDESLVLTIETTTSSENNRDKIKELTLKLKREADVTIVGKSKEQSYSYRNMSEGKSNFAQRYQIEKFGRSPLNEIRVEINIPHIFKTDNGREINFVTLYPPSGTLADQEVICSSNFTYITEDRHTSADQIDSEVIEDDAKTRSQRSLKEREVNLQSMSAKLVADEFESSQNRTFYINCSMEQVVCSKVICRTGPLRSHQVVKIDLKMIFDIASIEDVLNKKDIVQLATEGRVTVISPTHFVQSGDRPDNAVAVSLFIKESQTEPIALWIIILSAVVGLILLLLLIFGLIKLGFFKRTRKEELEQLKKSMENDACENLNKEENEDEMEE